MTNGLAGFAGDKTVQEEYGSGLDELGSSDKWKKVGQAMDSAYNGLKDTIMVYAEGLGTFKKLTNALQDKSGRGAGSLVYNLEAINSVTEESYGKLAGAVDIKKDLEASRNSLDSQLAIAMQTGDQGTIDAINAQKKQINYRIEALNSLEAGGAGKVQEDRDTARSRVSDVAKQMADLDPNDPEYDKKMALLSETHDTLVAQIDAFDEVKDYQTTKEGIQEVRQLNDDTRKYYGDMTKWAAEVENYDAQIEQAKADTSMKSAERRAKIEQLEAGKKKAEEYAGFAKQGYDLKDVEKTENDFAEASADYEKLKSDIDERIAEDPNDPRLPVFMEMLKEKEDLVKDTKKKVDDEHKKLYDPVSKSNADKRLNSYNEWLSGKAADLHMRTGKDALALMAMQAFDSKIEATLGSASVQFLGPSTPESGGQPSIVNKPATGLYGSFEQLKNVFENGKDFVDPQFAAEMKDHLGDYEQRLSDLKKNVDDMKKDTENAKKDGVITDKEKKDHQKKQHEIEKEMLDLAGDMAKDFKEWLKEMAQKTSEELDKWWTAISDKMGEVPGAPCNKDPPTACSQSCPKGIYGQAEIKSGETLGAPGVPAAGGAQGGAAGKVGGMFTLALKKITGSAGIGGVPVPSPEFGGEFGGVGPGVSGGDEGGMAACVKSTKCLSFPEPKPDEGGAGAAGPGCGGVGGEISRQAGLGGGKTSLGGEGGVSICEADVSISSIADRAFADSSSTARGTPGEKQPEVTGGDGKKPKEDPEDKNDKDEKDAEEKRIALLDNIAASHSLSPLPGKPGMYQDNHGRVYKPNSEGTGFVVVPPAGPTQTTGAAAPAPAPPTKVEGPEPETPAPSPAPRAVLRASVTGEVPFSAKEQHDYQVSVRNQVKAELTSVAERTKAALPPDPKMWTPEQRAIYNKVDNQLLIIAVLEAQDKCANGPALDCYAKMQTVYEKKIPHGTKEGDEIAVAEMDIEGDTVVLMDELNKYSEELKSTLVEANKIAKEAQKRINGAKENYVQQKKRYEDAERLEAMDVRDLQSQVNKGWFQSAFESVIQEVHVTDFISPVALAARKISEAATGGGEKISSLDLETVQPIIASYKQMAAAEMDAAVKIEEMNINVANTQLDALKKKIDTAREKINKAKDDILKKYDDLADKKLNAPGLKGHFFENGKLSEKGNNFKALKAAEKAAFNAKFSKDAQNAVMDLLKGLSSASRSAMGVPSGTAAAAAQPIPVADVDFPTRFDKSGKLIRTPLQKFIPGDSSSALVGRMQQKRSVDFAVRNLAPSKAEMESIMTVKGNKLSSQYSIKGVYLELQRNSDKINELADSGNFDKSAQALVPGQEGPAVSPKPQPSAPKSPAPAAVPSQPQRQQQAPQGVPQVAAPRQGVQGAVVAVTGAEVDENVIVDKAKMVGDAMIRAGGAIGTAAIDYFGFLTGTDVKRRTREQQEYDKELTRHAHAEGNVKDSVNNVLAFLDKKMGDLQSDITKEVQQWIDGGNLNEDEAKALLWKGRMMTDDEFFKHLNDWEKRVTEERKAKSEAREAEITRLTNERIAKSQAVQKEYEQKVAACKDEACKKRALQEVTDKIAALEKEYSPKIKALEAERMAESLGSFGLAAGFEDELGTIKRLRNEAEDRVMKDESDRMHKDSVKILSEYLNAVDEDEAKGFKTLSFWTEVAFEKWAKWSKERSKEITDKLQKGLAILNKDIEAKLRGNGKNLDTLLMKDVLSGQPLWKTIGEGTDPGKVRDWINAINVQNGWTGEKAIDVSEYSDDELRAVGFYFATFGQALAKKVEGTYTDSDMAQGFYKTGGMRKKAGDFAGALGDLGAASTLDRGGIIGDAATILSRETEAEMKKDMMGKLIVDIVLDPLNYITLGGAAIKSTATIMQKGTKVLESFKKIESVVRTVEGVSKTGGAALGKGIRLISTPFRGKEGKIINELEDAVRGLEDTMNTGLKQGKFVKGSEEAAQFERELEQSRKLLEFARDAKKDTGFLTKQRNIPGFASKPGQEAAESFGKKYQDILRKAMDAKGSPNAPKLMAEAEKAGEQFKTIRKVRDLIQDLPKNTRLITKMPEDAGRLNRAGNAVAREANELFEKIMSPEWSKLLPSALPRSVKASAVRNGRNLAAAMTDFEKALRSGKDVEKSFGAFNDLVKTAEKSKALLEAGEYMSAGNRAVRGFTRGITNRFDDAAAAIRKIPVSEVKNARQKVYDAEKALLKAFASNDAGKMNSAWDSLEGARKAYDMARDAAKAGASANKLRDARDAERLLSQSELPAPVGKTAKPHESAKNVQKTLESVPGEKVAEQAKVVENEASKLKGPAKANAENRAKSLNTVITEKAAGRPVAVLEKPAPAAKPAAGAQKVEVAPSILNNRIEKVSNDIAGTEKELAGVNKQIKEFEERFSNYYDLSKRKNELTPAERKRLIQLENQMDALRSEMGELRGRQNDLIGKLSTQQKESGNLRAMAERARAAEGRPAEPLVISAEEANTRVWNEIAEAGYEPLPENPVVLRNIKTKTFASTAEGTFKGADNANAKMLAHGGVVEETGEDGSKVFRDLNRGETVPNNEAVGRALDNTAEWETGVSRRIEGEREDAVAVYYKNGQKTSDPADISRFEEAKFRGTETSYQSNKEALNANWKKWSASQKEIKKSDEKIAMYDQDINKLQADYDAALKNPRVSDAEKQKLADDLKEMTDFKNDEVAKRMTAYEESKKAAQQIEDMSSNQADLLRNRYNSYNKMMDTSLPPGAKVELTADEISVLRGIANDAEPQSKINIIEMGVPEELAKKIEICSCPTDFDGLANKLFSEMNGKYDALPGMEKAKVDGALRSAFAREAAMKGEKFDEAKYQERLRAWMQNRGKSAAADPAVAREVSAKLALEGKVKESRAVAGAAGDADVVKATDRAVERTKPAAGAQKIEAPMPISRAKLESELKDAQAEWRKAYDSYKNNPTPENIAANRAAAKRVEDLKGQVKTLPPEPAKPVAQLAKEYPGELKKSAETVLPSKQPVINKNPRLERADIKLRTEFKAGEDTLNAAWAKAAGNDADPAYISAHENYVNGLKKQLNAVDEASKKADAATAGELQALRNEVRGKLTGHGDDALNSYLARYDAFVESDKELRAAWKKAGFKHTDEYSKAVAKYKEDLARYSNELDAHLASSPDDVFGLRKTLDSEMVKYKVTAAAPSPAPAKAAAAAPPPAAGAQKIEVPAGIKGAPLSAKEKYLQKLEEFKKKPDFTAQEKVVKDFVMDVKKEVQTHKPSASAAPVLIPQNDADVIQLMDEGKLAFVISSNEQSFNKGSHLAGARSWWGVKESAAQELKFSQRSGKNSLELGPISEIYGEDKAIGKILMGHSPSDGDEAYGLVLRISHGTDYVGRGGGDSGTTITMITSRKNAEAIAKILTNPNQRADSAKIIADMMNKQKMLGKTGTTDVLEIAAAGKIPSVPKPLTKEGYLDYKYYNELNNADAKIVEAFQKDAKDLEKFVSEKAVANLNSQVAAKVAQNPPLNIPAGKKIPVSPDAAKAVNNAASKPPARSAKAIAGDNLDADFPGMNSKIRDSISSKLGGKAAEGCSCRVPTLEQREKGLTGIDLTEGKISSQQADVWKDLSPDEIAEMRKSIVASDNVPVAQVTDDMVKERFAGVGKKNAQDIVTSDPGSLGAKYGDEVLADGVVSSDEVSKLNAGEDIVDAVFPADDAVVKAFDNIRAEAAKVAPQPLPKPAAGAQRIEVPAGVVQKRLAEQFKRPVKEDMKFTPSEEALKRGVLQAGDEFTIEHPAFGTVRGKMTGENKFEFTPPLNREPKETAFMRLPDKYKTMDNQISSIKERFLDETYFKPESERIADDVAEEMPSWFTKAPDVRKEVSPAVIERRAAEVVAGSFVPDPVLGPMTKKLILTDNPADKVYFHNAIAEKGFVRRPQAGAFYLGPVKTLVIPELHEANNLKTIKGTVLHELTHHLFTWMDEGKKAAIIDEVRKSPKFQLYSKMMDASAVSSYNSADEITKVSEFLGHMAGNVYKGDPFLITPGGMPSLIVDELANSRMMMLEPDDLNILKKIGMPDESVEALKVKLGENIKNTENVKKSYIDHYTPVLDMEKKSTKLDDEFNAVRARLSKIGDKNGPYSPEFKAEYDELKARGTKLSAEREKLGDEIDDILKQERAEVSEPGVPAESLFEPVPGSAEAQAAPSVSPLENIAAQVAAPGMKPKLGAVPESVMAEVRQMPDIKPAVVESAGSELGNKLEAVIPDKKIAGDLGKKAAGSCRACTSPCAESLDALRAKMRSQVKPLAEQNRAVLEMSGVTVSDDLVDNIVNEALLSEGMRFGLGHEVAKSVLADGKVTMAERRQAQFALGLLNSQDNPAFRADTDLLMKALGVDAKQVVANRVRALEGAIKRDSDVLQAQLSRGERADEDLARRLVTDKNMLDRLKAEQAVIGEPSAVERAKDWVVGLFKREAKPAAEVPPPRPAAGAQKIEAVVPSPAAAKPSTSISEGAEISAAELVAKDDAVIAAQAEYNKAAKALEDLKSAEQRNEGVISVAAARVDAAAADLETARINAFIKSPAAKNAVVGGFGGSAETKSAARVTEIIKKERGDSYRIGMIEANGEEYVVTASKSEVDALIEGRATISRWGVKTNEAVPPPMPAAGAQKIEAVVPSPAVLKPKTRAGLSAELEEANFEVKSAINNFFASSPSSRAEFKQAITDAQAKVNKIKAELNVLPAEPVQAGQKAAGYAEKLRESAKASLPARAPGPIPPPSIRINMLRGYNAAPSAPGSLENRIIDTVTADKPIQSGVHGEAYLVDLGEAGGRVMVKKPPINSLTRQRRLVLEALITKQAEGPNVPSMKKLIIKNTKTGEIEVITDVNGLERKLAELTDMRTSSLASRDKEVYMVTDLVEGAGENGVALTLEEFLSVPGNKIRPEAYDDFIESIIKMHAEKGIVHLDLNRKNILVDFKGNLKIVDFGAAQTEKELGAAKFTQAVGNDFATINEEIRSAIEKVGWESPVPAASA
jgi:hypothetical protein